MGRTCAMQPPESRCWSQFRSWNLIWWPWALDVDLGRSYSASSPMWTRWWKIDKLTSPCGGFAERFGTSRTSMEDWLSQRTLSNRRRWQWTSWWNDLIFIVLRFLNAPLAWRMSSVASLTRSTRPSMSMMRTCVRHYWWMRCATILLRSTSRSRATSTMRADGKEDRHWHPSGHLSCASTSFKQLRRRGKNVMRRHHASSLSLESLASRTTSCRWNLSLRPRASWGNSWRRPIGVGGNMTMCSLKD